MKTTYYHSLEETRKQPSGPGPIGKVDLDFLTRKCTFYAFLTVFRRKDWTINALDIKCETKNIVADLCHQYVPSMEKHGKTTGRRGSVLDNDYKEPW